MEELQVKPEPDLPKEKAESNNLLDDLSSFLGCFMLSGMCLLPLFKILSPTKNEWTIPAFLMTSVLVGFALSLLVKILNKLNHK